MTKVEFFVPMGHRVSDSPVAKMLNDDLANQETEVSMRFDHENVPCVLALLTYVE